jgi:hypothetical protein
MEFYQARRERMRQRLAMLLSPGTEAQAAAAEACPPKTHVHTAVQP